VDRSSTTFHSHPRNPQPTSWKIQHLFQGLIAEIRPCRLAEDWDRIVGFALGFDSRLCRRIRRHQVDCLTITLRACPSVRGRRNNEKLVCGPLRHRFTTFFCSPPSNRIAKSILRSVRRRNWCGWFVLVRWVPPEYTVLPSHAMIRSVAGSIDQWCGGPWRFGKAVLPGDLRDFGRVLPRPSAIRTRRIASVPVGLCDCAPQPRRAIANLLCSAALALSRAPHAHRIG